MRLATLSNSWASCHCCCCLNVNILRTSERALLVVGAVLLHCSLGLEILEDLEDPDVILVPCGGGALLAGVAAAVKLSGLRQCRIYGVEPQGGKYRSYIIRSGTDLISLGLLILLSIFLLPKKLKALSFKSDCDEIWFECPSNK